MGFSTSVHGQAAHEALLIRQEAELRLLETMKKSLQMKVKCDREYAACLLAAVMHGQKVELGEGANDSGVLQAWKSMLEGYEFVAKLVKNNSDQIESKVLDRLNSLYVEKRKAKKFYTEEHARFTQQFAKLADDVTRKKVEYQKGLDVFKLMRARFEDFYVKNPRAGNKKLDDLREKYQKASRKLHQIHNEYVLLLAEATEFERDYRTVIFPGLLENHQTVQEALVEEWKIILEEVAKHSSLCTDQFQDLEARVSKIVEGIRPNHEYLGFSEKFRSSMTNVLRSSPNHSNTFLFDQSLVEDAGKLHANQLAVDSTTVDWLRTRLGELDGRVKTEQERMLQLGETIINHSKVQEPNNPGLSSPELSRRRRELMEMRCDERKLTRQLELIKSALNSLDGEELPAGCECSTENSLGASLDPEEPLTRPPSSLSLQKRALTTILNHVRKKSTPATQRRVPDTPEPEVGDQVEVICFSRVRANTNQLYQWGLVTSRALVEEEWFHGVLPREEVVRLLNKEGDFLLRETTRNEENQTVLSVAWGGHKHFIVQTTSEGLFRFEGPAFPTIQELIVHQYQSGLPITARSGAILKRPILRERWELNNDDVILLDKIGRGNFGDVYKARLKRNKQEVAVKTCRMTLPEEQKKKFLQEGRILKQYDHPNVVKLVGICVQKQPIMIVMELVPGGSLLTFLRNNATNLTERKLLRMCKDVAAGMRYLESRNCIHRDLAARNCLIGHEEMVKISDFGMSREEEEYIVSDGMKQIPIKWTAPEALNFGKYTSLCDVWSYGVLAWEVFARGEVPYPGMSNSKARERIDNGYRMAAPDGTPDEMYQLMLRCWEYQPENRPHFDEIYTIVYNINDRLHPE